MVSTNHPSLLNHLIMIKESQMGFPPTILKNDGVKVNGKDCAIYMENKKWLKPPTKFHLSIFHLIYFMDIPSTVNPRHV